MIHFAIAILVVWIVFKYFSKLIKWVLIIFIAWVSYCCLFVKIYFGPSLFDKKVHQLQKHIGAGTQKGVDSAIDISVDYEGAQNAIKKQAGSIVDSLNIADMVPHEVKF